MLAHDEAEALEAAGIDKAHAKAIAVAIRNGHGALATKVDIGALKADIVRVESRIDALSLWSGLPPDWDGPCRINAAGHMMPVRGT